MCDKDNSSKLVYSIEHILSPIQSENLLKKLYNNSKVILKDTNSKLIQPNIQLSDPPIHKPKFLPVTTVSESSYEDDTD